LFQGQVVGLRYFRHILTLSAPLSAQPRHSSVVNWLIHWKIRLNHARCLLRCWLFRTLRILCQNLCQNIAFQLKSTAYLQAPVLSDYFIKLLWSTLFERSCLKLLPKLSSKSSKWSLPPIIFFGEPQPKGFQSYAPSSKLFDLNMVLTGTCSKQLFFH